LFSRTKEHHGRGGQLARQGEQRTLGRREFMPVAVESINSFVGPALLLAPLDLSQGAVLSRERFFLDFKSAASLSFVQ
jgi:hypothetical protein